MSEIYAYSNEVSTHTIEQTDSMLDYDSLIVPCSFDIYEKPDDAPEVEDEPVGEYIGCVTGFLVLGHEIERRKPSEYMNGEMFMNLLCDDMTADLGNVVAALLKNDGPLVQHCFITGIDHFYIDEVDVERPELVPLILREIPNIVFKQMHVFPELVSYYPRPLPHEPEQTERDKLLLNLAQCTNTAIMMLMASGEYDDDNPQCVLTPEQIRLLREAHQSGSSYPAKFKDRKLWKPFLDAGFREWEDTRVLYCCIDRDV